LYCLVLSNSSWGVLVVRQPWLIGETMADIAGRMVSFKFNVVGIWYMACCRIFISFVFFCFFYLVVVLEFDENLTKRKFERR